MADLNTVPTQPEFVQYRNKIFAMQHGGQPLWTVGQLNQAIGTQVLGRTWDQINKEMRYFLATAPKA